MSFGIASFLSGIWEVNLVDYLIPVCVCVGHQHPVRGVVAKSLHQEKKITARRLDATITGAMSTCVDSVPLV